MRSRRHWVGRGVAAVAFGLIAVVALIDASAHAATKADQCWSTHKACISRCKRVFEGADRINACFIRCDTAVIDCIPTGGSGSMVQTDKDGRPVKPGVVIPRAPAGGILQTGPNLPTQRPPSTGTAAPN
ncbi:MAG TPA: hypothetical protein VNR39_11985 [Pseudolabrys sp.]|nr:hypothetical protein [Pseudolabrys sp.]